VPCPKLNCANVVCPLAASGAPAPDIAVPPSRCPGCCGTPVAQ
jgi:hypothetical protein